MATYQLSKKNSGVGIEFNNLYSCLTNGIITVTEHTIFIYRELKLKIIRKCT